MFFNVLVAEYAFTNTSQPQEFSNANLPCEGSDGSS
jgi:hypothetical protein